MSSTLLQVKLPESYQLARVWLDSDERVATERPKNSANRKDPDPPDSGPPEKPAPQRGEEKALCGGAGFFGGSGGHPPRRDPSGPAQAYVQAVRGTRRGETSLFLPRAARSGLNRPPRAAAGAADADGEAGLEAELRKEGRRVRRRRDGARQDRGRAGQDRRRDGARRERAGQQTANRRPERHVDERTDGQPHGRRAAARSAPSPATAKKVRVEPSTGSGQSTAGPDGSRRSAREERFAGGEREEGGEGRKPQRVSTSNVQGFEIG